MEDPYIGTIIPWSGSFVPKGWLSCNGATLPIAQNQALFAVIGNTYGGDGRTNFMLPNLSCRFPMGEGTSQAGTASGNASITLTVNNLKSHTHTYTALPTTVPASLNSGKAQAAAPLDPNNAVIGNASSTFFRGYKANGTPDTPVAGLVVDTQLTCSTAGSTPPIATLPPYVAMMYIIANIGIFPPYQY